MSSDPGDLANMADLVLPEAVSFWPPAAGIWIIGAMAAAMLTVSTWRALRRYRADAYLRRALAELDALAGGGDQIGEATSAILKRAAMVAYGRKDVASLTGSDWAAFVARTTPPGVQTDDLTKGLADLFAPATAVTANDPSRFVVQARAWLRGQRGRATREA